MVNGRIILPVKFKSCVKIIKGDLNKMYHQFIT